MSLFCAMIIEELVTNDPLATHRIRIMPKLRGLVEIRDHDRQTYINSLYGKVMRDRLQVDRGVRTMASTLETPRITIVEDLCKGCRICIEFCPAKILKVSSHMTKKGIYPPEVIDATKCTGCRICQYYCPDLAIYVVGRLKRSNS
jgi:2-oxoglutarate ferredoxin oxidoreductase subunit delta